MTSISFDWEEVRKWAKDVDEELEDIYSSGYQKQDWNKRARGFKVIFDSSSLRIRLAVQQGKKEQVAFYIEAVKKRLKPLINKIVVAEQPKAFSILFDNFQRWLKEIGYYSTVPDYSDYMQRQLIGEKK